MTNIPLLADFSGVTELNRERNSRISANNHSTMMNCGFVCVKRRKAVPGPWELVEDKCASYLYPVTSQVSFGSSGHI